MAEIAGKKVRCDVPHCPNSVTMPEGERYPALWYPKGWGRLHFFVDGLNDVCPAHVKLVLAALNAK